MIVLFDMDMTLVDTSSLETFRSKGQWSKIDSEIHTTIVYPGVDNLLKFLKKESIKCGVVTSSPRKYAEKIIAYHNIDIPISAAYHDTTKHKPSPDPYKLALKKLNYDGSESIVIIGDTLSDMVAAKDLGKNYGEDYTFLCIFVSNNDSPYPIFQEKADKLYNSLNSLNDRCAKMLAQYNLITTLNNDNNVLVIPTRPEGILCFHVAWGDDFHSSLRQTFCFPLYHFDELFNYLKTTNSYVSPSELHIENKDKSRPEVKENQETNVIQIY